MTKTITVFGTSKAEPGDEVYELAGELGKLLAEAGFAIANGGYGGTMLAAAEGAAKAGGKVVGVTCSAFKKSCVNEYVEKEIRTDSLTERLGKLVELGDGYVVLPGGTGTLLELAEVWELKNKGFLNNQKPIILLGDFWESLIELMGKEDKKSLTCIEIAGSCREVVEILSKE